MRPGSTQRTNRFIRGRIYALKRRFGFPIEVCLENIGAYNPETGTADIAHERYPIRRAIVFPGMVHRDIFYSISFLRANSNFTYGGDIENDDRSIIIDGRDLPPGFILTQEHYYLFNNLRWDLKDFVRLEDGISYFINLRRSGNADSKAIYKHEISDSLTLSESYVKDNP